MNTKADQALLEEVARAELHMHDSEIRQSIETTYKDGKLKKKRCSRKDARLQEAVNRAVAVQVAEADSEQLANRLLHPQPKTKKARTNTGTPNERKCSSCGNTGHNVKTCSNPKRARIVAAGPVGIVPIVPAIVPAVSLEEHEDNNSLVEDEADEETDDSEESDDEN